MSVGLFAVRALRRGSWQWPGQRACRALFASGAQGRTPLILADIGEGIAEVEVMRWHIAKGDAVSQFQPLVDVQSDKATVEITSRFGGVVDELSYAEGDIAAVGSPLCYIMTEDTSATVDEDASGSDEEESSDPASDTSTVQFAQEAEQVEEGEFESGPENTASPGVLATPAVRRIAREQGIDLKSVRGSGKHGRVTKSDLYQYDDASKVDSAPSPREEPASLSSDDVTGTRSEPIRGLRRAMVKSMTAAASVPQFSLGDEIAVDCLVAMRRKLARLTSERLTYMPFFIKATSLSLSKFPILNASVDAACENITYHPSHNISVAMDTDAGLIVPNIKSVERLSLLDIARELARLGEAAKAGKIGEEDLRGGTFSLSNIGSIGGTYASPIVFLPQVGIGALGKIRTRATVGKDGEVGVGEYLTLTWAADHRIVDGATLANFNNEWRGLIENPESMLLNTR